MKPCPYCGDCPPDGECGCIASEDVAALRAQVEDLKSAGRTARDDATSALDLLSRVRFALGDNGTRMQAEFLEYCAELRDAMALAKQACDERDHYGQTLTNLLDDIAPSVGRFTDGTPIDPIGLAYDAACEEIGRDPFNVSDKH